MSSNVHEMNLVVKFGDEIWVCRAYDIHLRYATGADELQYHRIEAKTAGL